MQKITPFLWFNDKAEEAAKYYVSIFKKDSKIISVARYNEAGPGRKDTVMVVQFKLHGQEFQALNGGPYYQLTPAFSIYVNCKTQKEVDTLWAKLLRGGKASQCGWLTDKYGVSWQIIPEQLQTLLQSKDKAKAKRVMDAMLKMVKINIKELQAAASG